MSTRARFHEISLATPDIGASMAFYQGLGFEPVATGDVLAHRYGVVTDGRLVLGLHEDPQFIPGLTFVRPELAGWVAELQARGFELAQQRIHPEAFNEAELLDPAGHRLWFLEAPIHAPVKLQLPAHPGCGEFLHLGLPARDAVATAAFWEQFGFVALGEDDSPYPHQSLTSDHLNLALHSPRMADGPILVFDCAQQDLPAAVRRGDVPVRPSPRGLGQGHGTTVEAPEGTLLLLNGA